MMASKDDEVYFHHNGEPKSGKVVCTGRHGCTVDHGGQQHKLKWEQIAGHKSRAPQSYKIVEQGEDGIIVEDNAGTRRFVAIPPEARAVGMKLEDQK